MHLVSDLQRRPNKGRLKCEKRIVPFYDICSIVQLVCMVAHATLIWMAANRTFVHSIWLSNPLVLADNLQFRIKDCVLETKRPTLYAFYEVKVQLRAESVNEIFAEHAVQMQLGIFLAFFALLCGVVNRLAVEINFFQWNWRNFVLRKDLFSALELGLLCCLLRALLMANVAGGLLSDYLLHCNVLSRGYLPFCSTLPLFLFTGAGCLTYAVGMILYLWNALPKYGIMTEEETVDYKAWLRNKRACLDEARRATMEAMRAKVRLRLMLHDQDMPQLRESGHQSFARSSTRPNFSARHDVPNPSLSTPSVMYNLQPVNMPRRRDTSVVRHYQQREEHPGAGISFYPASTGIAAPHTLNH